MESSFISIPGSKAMTLRALMLGALSDGIGEITNISLSEETQVLIYVLRQLGLMVQLNKEERSCLIGGWDVNHFPKQEVFLDLQNEKNIAYFVLIACAAAEGSYYLNANAPLSQYSMDTLFSLLSHQGAKIFPTTAENLPITLNGADGLLGGELEINGPDAEQIISALLLVAPFAQTALSIKTTENVQHSQIKMTYEMMADFDVRVHRMQQSRFTIPVPQRYQARDYRVEPDMVLASYLLAAAVLAKRNVTIPAINRAQPFQDSSSFIAILEKMGCKFDENENGLTLHPIEHLNGISVDMRHLSEVFPALVALAPFAKDTVTLTNIKDSSLIRAFCLELKKIGTEIEAGPDWLKIHPSELHPGKVSSQGDARLAMAFYIIKLIKPIEVDDLACILKIYPEFFLLWDKNITH